MKSAFAVLCVFGLLRAAVGQDAAPQGQVSVEKVRAAYREIAEVRDKSLKEAQELRERAKRYAEKSKERADLEDQARVAQKAAKTPLDPFVEVFRNADWDKFDPTSDKDLLRDGLSAVAVKPANGEKAVVAGRMFVKLFPEDRMVGGIQARLLPMSLLLLDRDDEAVKELRNFADANKDLRAAALMLLGDIECVRGNFAEAKKAFADAGAMGSKAIADISAAKSAVVGIQAPAIDSKHWIGGSAIPTADWKGKVVLLGFFGTWNPSARTALGFWSRMHDEHVADGLLCIGVSKQYPHGYLPADESQVESGGSSRQGMSLDDLVGHLTAYHTNTKMHMPFVVIDDKTFDAYGIKPIPTTVLLDREGRIALMATQVSDLEIARWATRRLLKKK